MKSIYRPAAAALLLFFLVPASQSLAAGEKKIRIGLPIDTPPFAFFDDKLQATRGFCVDLTLMAGKMLGSKIEFYGFNHQQVVKALETGQIDVIGCLFDTPSHESNYQLIDTGITVDRHLFAHKSCLTVTCLKDLPSHRIVGHANVYNPSGAASPVVPTILAASSAEALRILNDGGADVFIPSNSMTAMYQIQKLGFSNIKQVGLPFESVPLSLAVLKDRAELLSELSLTLGKIQQGEHFESLKQKWFGRDIKFSIWDRYIKYILMAGAGLALFLFLFAVWNIVLKRQVRSMTEDLVLSEEKYRKLIESSPDMIHIITDDGKIRMTNKRSKELVGCGGSQETDGNLIDLVIADQRDDMSCFIQSLFEYGYGENEFIFQNEQGTRLPVEIVATTLTGAGQLERMAACFSRDIRVRKSLEEELIRSERLAIMGQMSAGLAHEINNPLGIISSYAQDLLGGDVDAENRQYSLTVIADNAERAGRIVNGLLSFSRHNKPVRKPVDAAYILEASLFFVKSEVKRKQVVIERQFPQQPVTIYGDENQLIQVFVNLLINAVQAVAEKGQIRISCSGPKNEGREADFTIQDNGSGIKKADLGKLFEPFYSTKETGFGLGLFISHIIIERHNGRIRAESEEGYGTKMHVSLPLFSDQNATALKDGHA